ncbi:MAG: hypothetical protein ACFFCS_09210 [Candidatus Hodarchaeota archaeon]
MAKNKLTTTMKPVLYILPAFALAFVYIILMLFGITILKVISSIILYFIIMLLRKFSSGLYNSENCIKLEDLEIRAGEINDLINSRKQNHFFMVRYISTSLAAMSIDWVTLEKFVQNVENFEKWSPYQKMLNKLVKLVGNGFFYGPKSLQDVVIAKWALCKYGGKKVNIISEFESAIFKKLEKRYQILVQSYDFFNQNQSFAGKN